MPIIQRCAKCQWRFPLDADACPNPKCSTPVPRGLRNLYFRTKIKGKRHEKAAGFIPLQEARIKYAEWVTELSAPALPPIEQLSLKAISDAYIAKLKAEGKGYHRLAKLFLTRMQDSWGSDVAVVDISVEMIKRFQVSLRQSGASPAYCDRHLAIGKAAWNYSLPDAPNPFKRVKFYHPDNTLIRMLSPKEKDALIKAAEKCHHNSPQHFKEMIIVALYTGLREENVLKLHVDEVDFRTGKISLRQKRDLSFKTYMNSAVHEALKGIKPHEAGWFFPNPMTGKPFTRFDKTFSTIKTRAKITRPFRFHDLRHHFASELAKLTGNAVLVQMALGHRNIATSMRYIHLFEGALQTALENLITGSSKGSSEETKAAVNG